VYGNKGFAEPVLYVTRLSVKHVVHVFNYGFIAAYFNAPFEDIQVREIFETQQRLRYKNDAHFVESKDDTLEFLPRALNTLQTINIIRMYTLCDHALEHLYLTDNGLNMKKVDLAHTNFGKNSKYLSALITVEPSPEMDYVVRTPVDKYVEQIYTLPNEDEDGDTDEDSDESG
jgi:hypothetical protein